MKKNLKCLGIVLATVVVCLVGAVIIGSCFWALAELANYIGDYFELKYHHRGIVFGLLVVTSLGVFFGCCICVGKSDE
jgi:hypothetical protein